ncbi:DUF2953 domain-containing protein [Clostridiaceae bacterium 35-E11]
MQFLIYAIIVMCTIICILMITPLIIHIKILKDKTNDVIAVYFKALFGLLRYKLEVPLVDLIFNKDGKPFLKTEVEVKNNQKEQPINKGESFLTFKEIQNLQDKFNFFLNTYFDIFNDIRKEIKVKQLLWTTKFGVGDAAATGILSGVFWMMKSYIITLIKNNTKCSHISLDIEPHFNKEIFKTSLDCIISIKIGYIIIAAIQFGYTFLRKGGRNHGQSSN